MNINKLKKRGIVVGSVLLGLYVLFLLLPLVLSPIANSYTGDIEKMIKESTGFDAKVKGLSVVTGWNLSVGAKVDEFSLSVPASQDAFVSAEKVGARVAILPILARKIQVDSVFAKSLNSKIVVKKDGSLLIMDYIQDDINKVEKEAGDSVGLPLGIKLSNHLPNVSVDNYGLAVVDALSNKSYSIEGNNLNVSDFILDKSVKFSTNGKVIFDEALISNYDVKVNNKIMPNLQLHDLVFPEKEVAQDVEETEQLATIPDFNVIDILDKVKGNGFAADVVADVETFGTFKDPQVKGHLKTEDMTVAVDGKKLPVSYVDLNFKGNKTEIDSLLYSSHDTNEKTQIIGEVKTGKRPSVDMTFRSNAKFNNMFRLVDSIASSFGVNDFNTLRATGGIDADFNVTSDMKKVISNGYLKVVPSTVSYDLYKIKIDDIKANINFDNNDIEISDAGFSIWGHALKLLGSIKADSTTDLSLVANNLPLRGLLLASGQIALLKDNDINGGDISLNILAKGKLKEIKPELMASVSNINLYNKPSQVRVTLKDLILKAMYDGKKASGNVDLSSLLVAHPMAKITVPTTNIYIDEKDVKINNSYLLFNNSKINISGGIKDYLSDMLSIDVNANGAINSADVASVLPIEFRKLISYKGQMPLNVNLSGNTKVQNIKINLNADNNNYIALVDLDALKNQPTKITSNIEIIGDTLNLTNTSISNSSSTIATLGGNVNKLYTKPTLNLSLSIPNVVSFPIWGVPNSNISANANLSILGNAMNPNMRGTINLTDISMKDFGFAITDLVADVAGPILTGEANARQFKAMGLVATDLTADFALKDYQKFYLNNLYAKAFDGVVKGKMSYDIATTKIGLELNGSDLNSTKAIEGAVGIPNALTGVLNFNTKLNMKGVTDKEIINSMKGNVDFNINSGRFVGIGRLENLVGAQNVSSNSILRGAIAALSSVSIVQQADKFDSINGQITLGNGSAKIDKILVQGPLMSYYINGSYNILPNTASMIILGRLDSKVVSVLGPLGDLSAEKLLSFIPKFGAMTSNILNQMTSNPETEKTELIPALSSGSKEFKDFKVIFSGSAASTSSIKSFKWLTKCDTTAIDYSKDFQEAKEAVKNNINNVVETHRNNVQSMKDSYENAKVNREQSKENLKNLFNNVIKNSF